MFDNYSATAAPWWNGMIGPQQVIGPTNVWSSQYVVYQRSFRYYSGDVFNDVIQNAEAVNDQPQQLAQPVGLNLTKMLCVAMADALLGEWEERAVDFAFEEKPDTDQISEEERSLIRQFAIDLWAENHMDQKYWELGLDQNRYGGSVLKVSFDLKRESGIRLERIDPTAFYPIWDPDDLDHLLECYIAIIVPAALAEKLYGTSGAGSGSQPGGWVTRVEHWTEEYYETFIGTTKVEKLSGKNALGVVPFVYTPRFRSTGYYGESLAADVWRTSDELNFRIADLGESLNYNTHPIKYGTDLPSNFNQKNFPLSPGLVWNLGRTIGNEKAELGMLESKHAVPAEAFHYVKFLYDWARTASNAPPVAFGEDQGSQRSGATLILRMYPLIRAVKRSRAYNAAGIRQFMDIAFRIVKQKRPSTVDKRVFELIDKVKPKILWAPIIPRDRVQVVDEVTKRLSTNPQTISLRAALEALRDTEDIDDEIARIEEQQALAQATAAKTAPEGGLQKEPDELSVGENSIHAENRVAD